MTQGADKPRLEFRVEGLDCSDEADAIRRELEDIGLSSDDVRIDILGRRVSVKAAEVDEDEVVDAIRRCGLEASAPGDHEVGEADEAGRQRVALATALSGVCVALGFGWQLLSADGGAMSSDGHASLPLASRLAYLAGVLSGGFLVAPKALSALRRLRPDMNLLMCIAVAGAIAIGEWFEAGTVTFLFAVSLSLEQWSTGRARRAIEDLLDLAPPTALVISSDGNHQAVPAEDVALGTVFRVLPGEKIALDGEVVSGTTEVDQAPITGESRPVTKKTGDAVFAGTLNGDGAIDVRSTRRAEDTTLAQISRLVGEARAERSPSERWVDRFARRYTPIVLLIAVLTCVVPPLFGGAWTDWFYRSLVLLVIACPCALVISTPVTIVAALTGAARRGVLIKGAAHVETPATIRSVAFDKTGTLTSGRMQVKTVTPTAGHTAEEVLSVAAGLESHSEHPLARAIVAHAKSTDATPADVSDVRAIKGKGLRGTVDGRSFWMGSHRYLEERGQEEPHVHETLEAMSAKGLSVVVLGNDEHVCGFIGVGDTLRPEAKVAILRLRELEIQPLVMLTGDNEGTARSIGDELGLDEIHAELLPDEKIARIASMEDLHGAVAMLGDGVNDGPALARATLGVAMGAGGSDVAIETADVTLMGDDPSLFPWLVGHSRRTIGIVHQNIAIALGIKLLVCVLAATGMASLWMAIAADMGASLVVIFNGLRALESPNPT